MSRQTHGSHPYHWIAGSIKHPGYVRQATHTPAGKDIPESKIESAEHSRNPHLAAAAREAATLEHLRPTSGKHGHP